MTLPLNSRLSALYDTNGTQKDFGFGFRVFFDPDNGGYGLEVRRQTADGYEVIPKSDYLVLPVEDNSAGVVRFSVAPSAGQQIYIAGKTPTIQQLVLTNFGRYSAESIETQFDFITAIIQEWLSALGEETRQRIAADDILTQYVVQRIDAFVQQVNQNWDDKSQEIEDYIATIMPSFTQTLRDEIEAFAVAGMQDAIDQTLAESKAEIDDAVARANAAALAAAITGKVYDTPEAGVDPATGVQNGAYYNVRSPDDDSYLDEYQNIGGVPTPTGKSYPSIAALNNIPASKIKDSNGKDQQEINDAVAGRLLSSFGAIPDSPSSAIANRTALLTASLSGPVIIDGYYDIDVTGSTNDFVTSLHWVAARTGGQLNFKGTISNFIRVGSVDHVVVDKVKITSDNQSGVLMTILNNTVVINKLQFTCEIATGIGVFRGTWTNSIDPKVQYYGIKEANFNGAKLTNTNTAFMLINCPCDFFDIRNVNIRNMSFTPFSLGIDNNHLFSRSVKDLQKLLDADGLIAINDDDFWAGGSDGNYFTVVLFEGGHAKRSNTHVEGLKTTYRMSTYDFYLNCKSLEADNVFWKNNICFNSNKLNNELMKAKGTPDSTFTNGKFIVEKGFVLRHATDAQSQGWVTMFAKTYGNDKSKHVMNNNVIDVYMLLGMSAFTTTKSIEMLGNNIHAEIFASHFLNIGNAKSSDITTHADAEIVFKGNKIKFDKIDTIIRDGSTYSFGTLLRMSYTPELDTYHKITAENEVLIGEVSSGIFQMYDGSLAASELVIKDSVHINNCPIENNNRLFWGGIFLSTEKPAIVRQTAVSVPPAFNGALFSTLSLTRGGEQEFNLSLPYRGLSTYINGPVLAKKTIVVELSAAQGGVTFSAAYKLILETDGYTYQSAEDVYTKYPYPTVYTAATPIVSKIDAFDEIMAGVTFGVGTSDSQLIRIRYEFSQAVLSSLIDYKIKIRVV